MHAPCLPGLFTPAPSHKRQRDTSRGVYLAIRERDELRATEGAGTREAQVLRCLSAFCGDTGYWPTALELLSWMRNTGESVFDANSIRPRLTALVASGLVEAGGKAPCPISGKTVHTWGVRQR